MKKYLLTATFGIGLLLSSQAYAACGKTDVVAMTWASSEMATKVIEFVLRAGYGCEINSSSSSSVVAVTSMIEKAHRILMLKFGSALCKNL